MKNIMITSSGRRVSLINSFKKELKKIDPSAMVVALDAKHNISAAAHVADISLSICNVHQSNYIEELLSICIENNIKLVIPTIDYELEIMSKHRKEFKEKGIELLVSDHNFIRICSDKKQNQDFFEKNGIATPKVYSKTKYKFPLFIKPINGSNSANNHLISDATYLSDNYFNDNELLFFEYIDPNIYDEFTCDIYYDNNGGLKCVIPRKRIEVRGGEVIKGVTERNELVQVIKNRLGKISGARGCITMQFFVHKENGEIKGIEINARFGGGFPLSYLAGGNYPKWILEEYLLQKDIPEYDKWEENLLMLRYDAEILVHDYKT